MMEPGLLLFCFSLVWILIYAILVMRWTIGWTIQSQSNSIQTNSPSEEVTVIIAARNESESILGCLRALHSQNYPHHKIKIIISDDFSEDNTCEMVEDFIRQHKTTGPLIQLLKSNEISHTGKKAALERAIAIANSELIILTDADCTMGMNWIQSFVQYFSTGKYSMITGLVRINHGAGIFSKLQALEFLSLSGIGAASVILNKPLMCNGANLAFSKSAFHKVGGYTYGNSSASGDDTFLMLKMVAESGKKIAFNKNRESIVTTQPVSSLSQLFLQRIRWASKVAYYKENYIKTTGLFLFSVNFLLLCLCVPGLIGLLSWKSIIVLWAIKSSVDFLFFIPITRFAQQGHLLLLFLPSTLLYPFYALAGMITAALKRKYSWKGRSYNPS